MMRFMACGLLGVALIGSISVVVSTPSAADSRSYRRCDGCSSHVYTRKAHRHHSRGYRHAQVRGYTARRGGYSYRYADSINTYGDSRSLYGATLRFRDPALDRQTNAGPFDHGFFFDSGVAPRGGDSPYMH